MLSAPGVGVSLMDKWDPAETLRLIEEHRATHTHMVATMFHRLLALPEEERRAYGITDSLVRLSCGIEDPEDLIADLDQALTQV